MSFLCENVYSDKGAQIYLLHSIVFKNLDLEFMIKNYAL